VMVVVKRLGRPLAIWLGSFLIIATLLMVYARMPLGPILLAGGATFLITVIRAGRDRAA